MPEAPGRTVTLVPVAGATTWGVAYRLAGDALQQAATLAYLEHREQQYDVRHRVDVYRRHDPPAVPAVRGALVYVATPASPNWLGEAPLEQVARQVASAAGPSGPNHEYVTALAGAMRQMGVVDEELFYLEERVLFYLEALRAPPAATAHAARRGEGG
jgi:cation transport regulator ChaC